VEKLRAAGTEIMIRTTDEMVDTAFHRVQLMDLADLVPEEWMSSSCALGSTPGQNAALIDAWRRR
jgi:hypothetical protein